MNFISGSKTEFDGYYQTSKENAANFLIELEDDNFTNEDLRVLYILSPSLCSEDLMAILDEALRRTSHYPISREAICTRINYFGKCGVVFLPEAL